MSEALKGANPASFSINEENIKCEFCGKLGKAKDYSIIHNYTGENFKGDTHAITCGCTIPTGWVACGCGG